MRQRNGVKTVPREDQVGRHAADVRGRCGRHRDMRRRERGGVVEPVADHQHPLPTRGERLQVLDLFGRRAARPPDPDAGLRSDRLDCCGGVAGDDLDRHAGALEPLDRLARLGAQGLARGIPTTAPPAKAKAVPARIGASDPISATQAARPSRARRPATVPSTP